MAWNFTTYPMELPVTEREKIIELAVELGIGWAEGLSGMDDFLVTFYRKAQREAFEQAAKVCEKKWRKEDSFDSHANAKAIRQLIKE